MAVGRDSDVDDVTAHACRPCMQPRGRCCIQWRI